MIHLILAQLGSSLLLILNASPHEPILGLFDRRILNGQFLIRTGGKTLDHCVDIWTDEVRDRISSSSHSLLACESI